jgi:hypothetical protein
LVICKSYLDAKNVLIHPSSVSPFEMTHKSQLWKLQLFPIQKCPKMSNSPCKNFIYPQKTFLDQPTILVTRKSYLDQKNVLMYPSSVSPFEMTHKSQLWKLQLFSRGGHPYRRLSGKKCRLSGIDFFSKSQQFFKNPLPLKRHEKLKKHTKLPLKRHFDCKILYFVHFSKNAA